MKMLQIEESIRAWLEQATAANVSTSHRVVLKKNEAEDGTVFIDWETLFMCSPFVAEQPPFFQDQLQDYLVRDFANLPGTTAPPAESHVSDRRETGCCPADAWFLGRDDGLRWLAALGPSA